MPLTVLIADDEPLARERLCALIAALAPDASITECADGDAAVDALRDADFDAAFLDIQMPRLTGLEVVAKIGPADMPPTVFVTAFDAHAVQAFELAAIDYLLKPFDDRRFRATWDRLAEARGSRTARGSAKQLEQLLAALARQQTNAYPERLLIKDSDRTFPVSVSDIRWLESDGNYVRIITGAARHTMRETLANLESRLDPTRFVRIHRRVIVAIDQIRELQPWFGGDQVMILRDGTKLRVSRTRRDELAARLEGHG